MITTPALRQFMADRESLKSYARGELPSFDNIKRRLFLLERAQDHRLPDHFYKRGLDYSLVGMKSLHDLLTTGLYKLGSEHLELREKRINVKADNWSDWQELVTLCSPLVCISGLLWKKVFCPGTLEIGELADFTREWIEPNTLYTCLTSPRFPFMEKLLVEGGLSDLHIHLSGSTETDVAWQTYLQNPFSVYSEIEKASRGEKVKDQMDQEFICVGGALDFYHLLCTAIRLRYGFVHLLFNGRYTPELDEPFKHLNTKNILTSGGIAEYLIHPRLEHPLQRVFKTSPDPKQQSNWSDVSFEALMYVLVMDRIESSGNNELAACFHHYLLIIGLFNRFLVQQTHQYGFDQFQKITLNNFRDVPEKQYERRFFQLHGNDLTNLNILEGRFAPKYTVADNIRIVRQIVGGWKNFTSKIHCKSPRSKSQIRLVCHFIKEEDKNSLSNDNNLPKLLIRHQKLRIVNYRKARALVQAYETDETVRQYLCGVDAASNELEAPPEIYAPIYRYLRRQGIKHFTYHAGEDFHHLIGGLRAIYEAIKFLDLRRGDRIGHGTAAGIDPLLWLEHVGDEFAMSRGEWLDDLLFAIHLIEKNPAAGLTARLPLLRSEAEGLAHEIYRLDFSIYNHIRAWEARRCCPFHLLHDLDQAMGMVTWSLDEWRECEEFRHDYVTLALLELYHRADCRKRYHEITKVQVSRLFAANDMRIMQDILLAELHRKEIVLEVLPTSNVRISFYKNYKEHHIWRWLGLGKEQDGKTVAPSIVLGTDDTGIFSTNIYNEYCHIYQHLVETHKLEYSKASAVIQGIVENGKTYGFKVDVLTARL